MLDARAERSHVVLCLGLVAMMSQLACGRGPLHASESATSDRLTVRGSFCTSRPALVRNPVRVLFAVDYSNSLLHIDPDNHLIDALEQVTRESKDLSFMSFGILRWGDQAVRELVDCSVGTGVPSAARLFTRDPDELGAAFARLRLPALDYSKACAPKGSSQDKYLGGSDYVHALDAIRDYLEDDLFAHPELADHVEYHVVFVTDGLPASSAISPSATMKTILSGVIELVGRPTPTRLDTVLIARPFIPIAFEDLLPSMASLGKGACLVPGSPEELAPDLGQTLAAYRQLAEYQLASFSTPTAIRSFLGFNRNVRVARVGQGTSLQVDSDGDGLVDALERSLGLDPRRADTDGDGLDDLFEHLTAPELDPRTPTPWPRNTTDSDDDGILDFVEKRLGTDPSRADTDGDGAPDGVELRAGTNPLATDLDGDLDRDGISNLNELRQSLGADAAESEALRVERSTLIDLASEPYQVRDGRRCYRFSVSNLTLAETGAALDSQGRQLGAGHNQIELWRAERPILANPGLVMPAMIRHLRATVSVTYLPSEGVREPASLEVTVGDEDFR